MRFSDFEADSAVKSVLIGIEALSLLNRLPLLFRPVSRIVLNVSKASQEMHFTSLLSQKAL